MFLVSCSSKLGLDLSASAHNTSGWAWDTHYRPPPSISKCQFPQYPPSTELLPFSMTEFSQGDMWKDTRKSTAINRRVSCVIATLCVHSSTSYNLIFVRKWCWGLGKKGNLQVRIVALIEDLKRGYLISNKSKKSGFPAILYEDHAEGPIIILYFENVIFSCLASN